jgi:hypothetical protein
MRTLSICCGVLLMILGYSGGTLYAQGKPTSDVSFAKSSTTGLVNSLKLRRLSSDQPLEVSLKQENEALEHYFGFPTAIWVCEGCKMSSHPSAGIIVDLKQLAKVRQQADIQQFGAVLRFLLAHEKAHQVQYRQYSASISEAPEGERQAYEAQADILAGKYLISTLNRPWEQDQTQAVVDALRIAYDLGTEQYAIADHPSHGARLTAVRLGMSAGMVVKLNQLGTPPALSSATELARKIDIEPADDQVAWSLRTARRVINYRLPAIVSLVATEKRIQFNKTAANPTVLYDITYENRGDRSITVDLEVQSVAVPRDDLEDIFKWQKIDSASHRLSMPAHSKTVVSGVLRWHADADLEPRVIFPPTPTALISVQYSAGEQSAPAGTSFQTLNATSTAEERESFTSVLGRMITAAAAGFIDLRCGPGRKLDDEVIYPSCARFPRADDTTVWIPEVGAHHNPHVFGEFNSYESDKPTAIDYDDLLSTVRQYLQDLGNWKESRNTAAGANNAAYTFSLNQVQIRLSRHADDSIYITVEKMSP